MFRGILTFFCLISLGACSQKDSVQTAGSTATIQCSHSLFQHQQVQIHGLIEVNVETFSQFFRSRPNQQWLKAAMAETWSDFSDQNLSTSISVVGQQIPGENHPAFQVECASNQKPALKRKMLSNLGSVSSERNGYLKAGYALDTTIPFQTLPRNVTGALITETRTRKLNNGRMETLISYRYPTAIQMYIKSQNAVHDRLGGSFGMKFYISTNGAVPMWAISQTRTKKARDSSSHAHHETFEMYLAN